MFWMNSVSPKVIDLWLAYDLVEGEKASGMKQPKEILEVLERNGKH